MALTSSSHSSPPGATGPARRARRRPARSARRVRSGPRRSPWPGVSRSPGRPMPDRASRPSSARPSRLHGSHWPQLSIARKWAIDGARRAIGDGVVDDDEAGRAEAEARRGEVLVGQRQVELRRRAPGRPTRRTARRPIVAPRPAPPPSASITVRSGVPMANSPTPWRWVLPVTVQTIDARRLRRAELAEPRRTVARRCRARWPASRRCRPAPGRTTRHPARRTSRPTPSDPCVVPPGRRHGGTAATPGGTAVDPRSPRAGRSPRRTGTSRARRRRASLTPVGPAGVGRSPRSPTRSRRRSWSNDALVPTITSTAPIVWAAISAPSSTQVRVLQQDRPVLERAGLALGGVDHHRRRLRRRACTTPTVRHFSAGGEPGPPRPRRPASVSRSMSTSGVTARPQRPRGTGAAASPSVVTGVPQEPGGDGGGRSSPDRVPGRRQA